MGVSARRHPSKACRLLPFGSGRVDTDSLFPLCRGASNDPNVCDASRAEWQLSATAARNQTGRFRPVAAAGNHSDMGGKPPFPSPTFNDGYAPKSAVLRTEAGSHKRKFIPDAVTSRQGGSQPVAAIATRPWSTEAAFYAEYG